MLRRAVTLAAPTEAVWHAITDPAEVGRWFGARVEWDLRPGGRATFRDGSGVADREGIVEDVAPGRLLRFRWWPAAGADGPEGSDVSEVAYELEAGEQGTVLTVTERRLAPVAPPAGDGPPSARTGSGRDVAASMATAGGPWSVVASAPTAAASSTWSVADEAALALWATGPGPLGDHSDRRPLPVMVCCAR